MLKHFIDLVFPNPCLSCGQKLGSSEKLVCSSCLLDLPYTKEHLNPTDAESAKLFWGKEHIKNTYTAFYFQKGNVVQRLMHQLKYKNQPVLGEEMGRWMGKEILKYNTALPQMIVPVPLHPKRQRQRGYNQSYLLAKGVGEVLSIPVDKKLVKRNTHNTSQTKQSRFSRWENVAEIFSVQHHPPPHVNHLMLLDDVITTGATLEALAGLLKKQTGCDVSIGALAITKT